MSEVTVKELRDLVDHWLNLKAEIKHKESEIKDIHKQLQPITDELNALMEAMDIERFEGSMGKISRVITDYVASPQTDDDKEAFHSFLKDEGLYEDMVSVNFQRLNSFYKERLAQAIEEGHELSIPGLEPKQRVEIRRTGK